MAQTKQKRQEESIEQMARDYYMLMREKKELEKECDIRKKALLDYAKELNVDSVKIADLTLEKRTTVKGEISPELVTPDWLYRMQRDGYAQTIKVSVEQKLVKVHSGDDKLKSYLDEVKYCEKESSVFAIRIL